MGLEEPISQELLAWFEAKGVMINKIAAGFIGNSSWRGVIATDMIEAHECVLRVPRISLMTTETARASDHPLITSCTLASNLHLGIFLLYEASKGASSPWWPYVASMPPMYTTLACFTSTDITALQVSYAVTLAEEVASQSTADWKQAAKVLKQLQIPPKWCYRQAWCWAASTISSRTMYLPWDEAGALTPFGDLHNHASPPPPYTVKSSLTSRNGGNYDVIEGNGECGDGSFDEASNEYRIYARKRYIKGDQVFLSYGRHSNLVLLHHYGFALPDNPHDTALLPIKAFHPSIHSHLHTSGVEPLVHHDGSPSWELLRALRLGCAPSEERRALAYLALEDKPMSSSSEGSVWEALGQACDKVLSALPTSIKQDEEILLKGVDGGGPLSETARVAVEWRVGYKRILMRCIEMCTNYKEYVDVLS